MLELWSSALDRLEYQEALDDPLVMAEHDAAGRCLTGIVVEVDASNREVKPGNKNRTQVPLLTMELDGSTMLLPGERVIWRDDERVKAIVRTIDDARATLAVTDGHKSAPRIPTRGSSAVFVALSLFGGTAPGDPPDVPWTHKSEDVEADATLAQQEDGSPDLSGDELAALPAAAGTAPEDVPGVVL
jgi:hypothetical protein